MKEHNVYLFIFLFSISFFVSCKKENVNKTMQNPHVISENIYQSSFDKLNNLIINKADISRLYNSFEDEYITFANNLRNIDTTEIPADTAIGQLETCINSDYGFPFDVAHKFDDTFDTLVFTITGYSQDSIPLIKSQELFIKYDSIKNMINYENNKNDSIHFWCTNMNIYQIDKICAKVMVTSMTSFAYPYKRILPPGVYPEPFPFPTCKYAGNPQNLDNAAKNFESKYEISGPPNAMPAGIVTLYQFYGLSHRDNGVGDKLWWHSGYNTEYLCANSSGGGKLNNFLFSTKDVIDEHNYSHDNIFLGNLNIYPFYVSYDPTYGPHREHIVEFYFYKITPRNNTK